jgi:hypothetical protein
MKTDEQLKKDVYAALACPCQIRPIKRRTRRFGLVSELVPVPQCRMPCQCAPIVASRHCCCTDGGTGMAS